MKKQYLSILFIGLLLACGSPAKKASQNEIEQSELEAFREKIQQVHPRLRNLEDISVMLQLSGVDYNPALSLDPQHWQKSSPNEALMAATMGMYIVDGLYQAAFDEKKNGYLSCKAAKSIAQELGIADIFDPLVSKRIHDGLVPEDSVFIQFKGALERSEKVLKEMEAMRLFSAMIVGSYIEKQYLLFTSVFGLPDDLSAEARLNLASRLIVVSGEELEQLPVLIQLIKDNQTPDDPGILYSEMLELENLRNKLGLRKKINTVDVSEFFNNAVLKKMHEKIVDMRRLLTKES
jgi:hypothetical protein